MVPLLSNPRFRSRTLPLSVEAWHGMVESGLAPARSELLRGVIVEKMPKSPLHTKLASRLWKAFESILAGSCWVRKEEPLTLADSEPEPDLAVVAGQEADYQKHPVTALIVIEVSVSTLPEDRELAALYAEAGIPEYWIVDGPGRRIEVYRRPENGRYQELETVMAGTAITSAVLPAVTIDTGLLFADLP